MDLTTWQQTKADLQEFAGTTPKQKLDYAAKVLIGLIMLFVIVMLFSALAIILQPTQ